MKLIILQLLVFVSLTACNMYEPKKSSTTTVDTSGSSTDVSTSGIPSYISLETKYDGTGTRYSSLDLTKQESIRLYAIARDSDDRFVSLVTAMWAISNSSIITSSSTTANTVIITAASAGSTTLTVTNPLMSAAIITATVSAASDASKIVIKSVSSTSVTVGSNITVTLELQDDFGNKISAAPSVTLVATGSVTGDGVVALVAGTKNVTITDTVAESVTLSLLDSSSTGYDVSDTQVVAFTYGSSVSLSVESISDPFITHSTSSMRVTALDTYGNTVKNYTGTVEFTSTDASLDVVLPDDYTFTSSDSGSHYFESEVVLATVGSQTVTATDTSNGSITGSQTVTVDPSTAAKILLEEENGLTTVGSGNYVHLKATIQDQYDNTVTSYTGTISFTSDGANAKLPVDYTFDGTEGGTYTFDDEGNTDETTILYLDDLLEYQTITATAGTLTGELELTVERQCPDPDNFIWVTANSAVGTDADFCVAKFETTGTIGTPTTTAGTPLTSITPYQAFTACSGMTEDYFRGDFAIISNPEWMTIARDAEAQLSNWTEGSYGAAMLYKGHSDNSAGVLSSVGVETNAYSGTGNLATNATGSGKEQRRSLMLSSGECIYDFSGNAGEWVDWDSSDGTFTINIPGITGCAAGPNLMSTACAALDDTEYRPSSSSIYNSATLGVGYWYGGGQGGGLVRGGQSNLTTSGIYFLNLYHSGNADSRVGFRCVYRPPAEPVSEEEPPPDEEL